jgi:hypothetical protein
MINKIKIVLFIIDKMQELQYLLKKILSLNFSHYTENF